MRQAEERLKFISEKIPLLFRQKDRGGTYLEVSKAFLDIYGLSEHESKISCFEFRIQVFGLSIVFSLEFVNLWVGILNFMPFEKYLQPIST
jgi:PAS domain-containing protein